MEDTSPADSTGKLARCETLLLLFSLRGFGRCSRGSRRRRGRRLDYRAAATAAAFTTTAAAFTTTAARLTAAAARLTATAARLTAAALAAAVTAMMTLLAALGFAAALLGAAALLLRTARCFALRRFTAALLGAARLLLCTAGLLAAALSAAVMTKRVGIAFHGDHERSHRGQPERQTNDILHQNTSNTSDKSGTVNLNSKTVVFRRTMQAAIVTLRSETRLTVPPLRSASVAPLRGAA